MRDPQFEVRPSLLVGDTAEVFYHRVLRIMRGEGINPVVVMEFTSTAAGVLCGIHEARAVLHEVLPEGNREVWALEEGSDVEAGEVVLRVKAPYSSFGLYETAICGILSHCTGWATAARQCVRAAGTVPVVSLGAHLVHPYVAGTMDYSAVVGGCITCSSVLGARLAGTAPYASVPRTLLALQGGPVQATQAFDKHIAPELPRVALLDAGGDPVSQSLEVAKALRDHLKAVRLDYSAGSPPVTPDTAVQVRQHLDEAGYKQVEIMVSGNLDPQTIEGFTAAGAAVDAFGVGNYIAAARPVEFTTRLRGVDGKPGSGNEGDTPNSRLTRTF